MSSKIESDFVTGVYRCKDPIKNLKVRVRLQQEKPSYVPLSEFQHDHGDTELPLQSGLDRGEVEEQTFSWQEKCFSPYEISKYQHSANCHTDLEEQYHLEVMKLCQDKIPSNRLFSKTDADDFLSYMDEINPVTTDLKPIITSLAQGFSELRLRQKFVNPRKTRNKYHDFPKKDIIDYAPTDELKRRNHLLESYPQVMYIMADLSIRDSDSDMIWYGKSEYVLCTIRFDLSSNVLSITPDFTSESPAEPYRIEVDGDARNSYLYWIEHVSVDISIEESEQEQQVMNKIYAHQINIRQLQVGNEFKTPRAGILDVLILGEICSAHNFEYDHLFVHYFFELPLGWGCDDPSQLSGVTQRCHMRGMGTANFAHLFEVPLSLNIDLLHNNSNTDTLVKWPQLYLEVLSLDTWGRYRTEGYGYVHVPMAPGSHNVHVSTWRPLSNSWVGEMRRFFTGGSPELEDVTYTGIPASFQGCLLSKYGMRTIASGDLRLHFNIVHQCQAFVVSSESLLTKPSATFMLERLSAATLVSTVNATLKAYKRAQERMLKSVEGVET